MKAEEIIQKGVLVDTEYHTYSDVNRRIVGEVYELEGERARLILGYSEHGAEYWFYTGINEIEKI